MSEFRFKFELDHITYPTVDCMKINYFNISFIRFIVDRNTGHEITYLLLPIWGLVQDSLTTSSLLVND